MTNSVEIGNRIFQLRKERRWTQQSLGDLLNWPQTHISKIENGQALDVGELEKLAKRFGVNPLYLIDGIPSNVSEFTEIMAKMEPDKRERALKLYLIDGITPDVSVFVEMMAKMESDKRKMALKLFQLTLEMMEITKKWPADAVTPNLAPQGK